MKEHAGFQGNIEDLVGGAAHQTSPFAETLVFTIDYRVNKRFDMVMRQKTVIGSLQWSAIKSSFNSFKTRITDISNRA